jgi:hypothetical protein
MTVLHNTALPLGKGSVFQLLSSTANGGRRGRPVVPRQIIKGAVLDDPALTPEAKAVLAVCLTRGLVLLGTFTEPQSLCLSDANEALFRLADEFTTAELVAILSGKLACHDVFTAHRAAAWRAVDLAS